MTLLLSGKTKRTVTHRDFYGPPVERMPFLVSGKDERGKVFNVPCVPASFAYIIKQRETASEDFRRAWQMNIYSTGDAVSLGVDGDIVSTWDSPILRTVTPESTLVDGALKLSTAQWNELRAQKDGTLYLSAEQVAETHGKGYVKKNGVWTPENTSVAKVWEHLSRGRDLERYAEMVADATPGIERILRVYFDQSRLSSPTLLSWVAHRIDNSSLACGDFSLEYVGGRLVGVAPEAHEKALEVRV